MRSQYVDKFNHDQEAPDYDADVVDETGPVREGYGRLLEWVAQQARCGPQNAVIELGTGTGNLAIRLAPPRAAGVRGYIDGDAADCE